MFWTNWHNSEDLEKNSLNSADMASKSTLAETKQTNNTKIYIVVISWIINAVFCET